MTLALSNDPAHTQALAKSPAVASIDFTGSNQFGRWLQDNARQARLYAEMAGVNSVIIESTNQYSAMLNNLAFTLSLYSGQMCTTTQNIYIPKNGIQTDQGAKSFDQVCDDLAAAVRALVDNPRVATAVLGAVCAPETVGRIEEAAGKGRVVLASQALPHPQYPNARIHSPVIVALTEADRATFANECFGPISFLIATESSDSALATAQSTLCEHGALTLGVYSTDRAYIERTGATVAPRPCGPVHQPHARCVRETSRPRSLTTTPAAATRQPTPATPRWLLWPIASWSCSAASTPKAQESTR